MAAFFNAYKKGASLRDTVYFIEQEACFGVQS
jgi:hypothetical protein